MALTYSALDLLKTTYVMKSMRNDIKRQMILNQSTTTICSIISILFGLIK